MNNEQTDQIKDMTSLLVSSIKSKWLTIKKNVDYLIKLIDLESILYNKIKKQYQKPFPETMESDAQFYQNIDLNDIHYLTILIETIQKCFSTKSAKYNSIFSLINKLITQVRDALRQKDQLGDYSLQSSNFISNEPIKEIFMDNMRKGVTSHQVDNFELRKQLKRTKEKNEALDYMTQKNLKFVAHSLLMYQEYRLKIESPQDSAKIEKRMFKSSLDLIYVTNSMTSPDRK